MSYTKSVTHLILETALIYQRAFERLEAQDGQSASDLKECPSIGNDWDNPRVLGILNHFF